MSTGKVTREDYILDFLSEKKGEWCDYNDIYKELCEKGRCSNKSAVNRDCHNLVKDGKLKNQKI